MIEIELKDIEVGKTYYLHQLRDEDTHEELAMTLKYKAICTGDYSTPGGWYDFGFDVVKGMNTGDIENGLGICLNEDAYGIYKYYLCESDEIIERVIERVMINTALRDIIGDPYFKFY
jgi:hypothetical protein